MAAKTVGFAISSEDRAELDRLVDRFGGGNRSEFLRAAMKLMTVQDRALRLRSIQERATDAAGRHYTPDEVNSIVRKVLESSSADARHDARDEPQHE
jgi:Arc/MetJ-type ribon-helix-helix transcriptional regulator